MRRYLENDNKFEKIQFLEKVSKLLSGASLTGDDALIQYSWVSRSDLLPLFSDATRDQIFKCSSENIMMIT